MIPGSSTTFELLQNQSDDSDIAFNNFQGNFCIFLFGIFLFILNARLNAYNLAYNFVVRVSI